MRTLSIQGLPDKRRQKVLIHDWPQPEGTNRQRGQNRDDLFRDNKRHGTESTDWWKLRAQGRTTAHRRERLPKCGARD